MINTIYIFLPWGKHKYYDKSHQAMYLVKTRPHIKLCSNKFQGHDYVFEGESRGMQKVTP